MAAGFNVETKKTNKQTNKQTWPFQLKYQRRLAFRGLYIYMAIFNPSSRVNPRLNKGYLARGVEPA